LQKLNRPEVLPTIHPVCQNYVSLLLISKDFNQTHLAELH
jgi:hypothetical protein